RRHTRSKRDWSSDVCSSDLILGEPAWVKLVCVTGVDTEDHAWRDLAWLALWCERQPHLCASDGGHYGSKAVVRVIPHEHHRPDAQFKFSVGPKSQHDGGRWVGWLRGVHWWRSPELSEGCGDLRSPAKVGHLGFFGEAVQVDHSTPAQRRIVRDVDDCACGVAEPGADFAGLPVNTALLLHVR